MIGNQVSVDKMHDQCLMDSVKYASYNAGRIRSGELVGNEGVKLIIPDGGNLRCKLERKREKSSVFVRCECLGRKKSDVPST